jgi:hypothetical protein
VAGSTTSSRQSPMMSALSIGAPWMVVPSALSSRSDRCSFQFEVSHAGQEAVYAVGVGVAIEVVHQELAVVGAGADIGAEVDTPQALAG